MVLNFL